MKRLQHAAVQAQNPVRVLSVPMAQGLTGNSPAFQASARHHHMSSPPRRVSEQALKRLVHVLVGGIHRLLKMQLAIFPDVCVACRAPAQQSIAAASSAPSRGRGVPQAWRAPAPVGRGRTPSDQGRGRGSRRPLQSLPVQACQYPSLPQQVQPLESFVLPCTSLSWHIHLAYSQASWHMCRYHGRQSASKPSCRLLSRIWTDVLARTRKGMQSLDLEAVADLGCEKCFLCRRYQFSQQCRAHSKWDLPIAWSCIRQHRQRVTGQSVWEQMSNSAHTLLCSRCPYMPPAKAIPLHKGAQCLTQPFEQGHANE